MMKTRAMTLGTILLLVSFVMAACAEKSGEASGTAPLPADEVTEATGTEGAGRSAGHQVATFAIAQLDQEATIRLTAALAPNAGVLSAQALPDSGLYTVAYRADLTTAAVVFEALRGVDQQISLRGVTEAQGPAHNCGGCPMQNACGSPK